MLVEKREIHASKCFILTLYFSHLPIPPISRLIIRVSNDALVASSALTIVIFLGSAIFVITRYIIALFQRTAKTLKQGNISSDNQKSVGFVRRSLILFGMAYLVYALSNITTYVIESNILSKLNITENVAYLGLFHTTGEMISDTDTFADIIKSLPEIENAIRAQILPLSVDESLFIREYGRIAVGTRESNERVQIVRATDEYFRVLGLRLSDTNDLPPIEPGKALVSKSLASRLHKNFDIAVGDPIEIITRDLLDRDTSKGIVTLAGILPNVPYGHYLTEERETVYVHEEQLFEVSDHSGTETYFLSNPQTNVQNVIVTYTGPLETTFLLVSDLLQSYAVDVELLGTPEGLFKSQFEFERATSLLNAGSATFGVILSFVGLIYLTGTMLMKSRRELALRGAIGHTIINLFTWKGGAFLEDVLISGAVIATIVLLMKLLVFESMYGILLWLLIPVLVGYAIITLTILWVTFNVVLKRSSLNSMMTS